MTNTETSHPKIELPAVLTEAAQACANLDDFTRWGGFDLDDSEHGESLVQTYNEARDAATAEGFQEFQIKAAAVFLSNF